MIYNPLRAKYDNDFTFPIEWRFRLVGLLLLYKRMYKEKLNARFLTSCRRENKIPRFIEELVKSEIPNTRSHRRYRVITVKCKRSILNNTITETFLKIRRLERKLDANKDEILKPLDPNNEPLNILMENSPAFICKHSNLIRQSLEDEKWNKQLRKLNNLMSWNEPAREEQSPRNERITVIGDIELEPETVKILDKGPMYVPGKLLSDREKKDILIRTEVGIERYIYAIRSISQIEESTKKQVNTLEIQDSSGKTLKYDAIHMKIPEKKKIQPLPLKNGEKELVLEDMKTEILGIYRKRMNVQMRK